MKTTADLRELARNTIDYCKTHEYNEEISQFEPLSRVVLCLIQHSRKPTLSITVKDVDCLVEAQKQLAMGFNPLVLNLASELLPGGGWLRGSLAQEESICYRSTLSASLARARLAGIYPIADEVVIYSPMVEVFRSQTYEKLPKQEIFTVAVVSCPGVRHPDVDFGIMNTRDYDRVKAKITRICQVGVLKEHDSLVLGALGCGVFKCPILDIVHAFHDVLIKSGFANFFKEITFAVLGKSFKEFSTEWEKINK